MPARSTVRSTRQLLFSLIMQDAVILVGTDFSPHGEAALRAAFRLAQAVNGRVELVHVTNEQKPLFGRSKESRAAVQRLQEEEVEESRRALERLLAEAEVPARAHVYVSIGDICQTLLDHADELNADVIVVSRHGFGAAGRFLLGSLTDKVVRRSHRPVLVIPPESS